MRASNQQIVEDWLRAHLRGTQAEQDTLAALAGRDGAVQAEDRDELIAEVARRIVSGQVHAVRLSKPVPPLDPPRVVDLADLAEPEPEPMQAERASWISVALAHAFEQPLDGTELELTGPDGRTHNRRMERDGRWRLDEVPAGWYELKLRRDGEERPRRISRRPSSPGPDDLVWEVGDTRSLRLHTAKHHRVLLMQPRVFSFSV